MSAPIHVLFATDCSYAPLCVIAVRSLLQSCDDPSALRIHIIDRGIPEHLMHLIDSYLDEAGCFSVKTIFDRAFLEKIDGLPVSFFDLPDTGHYDRLLAPYLIDASRALYFDTDILFQGDITELWTTDFEGHPVAAVQDQIIPTIDSDCGVIDWESKGFESGEPYFNSGVLVMDLDAWRKRSITESCIETALRFIDRFEGPPPLHDQYALNAVLYRDWKPLSLRWNTFAQKIKGELKDTIVVHFAGAHKPFPQSTIPSGPIRYFARIAQNLVKSDIAVAEETANCLTRQEWRYEDLLKSGFVIRTPNGRSVTVASSRSLGVAADSGPVAMVMPVSMSDPGSLRFRNFCFLVKSFLGHSFPIVIAEQENGTDLIGRFLGSLEVPNLHHLKLSFEDGEFHKTSLINRGAEFAFTSLDARYVWQLDADIYVEPTAVINQLGSLNSIAVPVVRPLLYFVRLDDAKSRMLLDSESTERVETELASGVISPYDIIDLFGPGSLIFGERAYREVGGMDESYTGWGWEDMDFAEKLEAVATPHTLPLVGYHLHHEEDRKPVPENFEKFKGTHSEGQSVEELERIQRHTVFHNFLGKFCLIGDPGDPWVETMGSALRSVESINFRDRPYCPDTLPFGSKLFLTLEDRIVNALTDSPCRSSGFFWDPGDSLRAARGGAELVPESLVDFIVATNFRIILIRPREASKQILWRRASALLERSFHTYLREPSLILKIEPASVGFDGDEAIGKCFAHIGCEPGLRGKSHSPR